MRALWLLSALLFPLGAAASEPPPGQPAAAAAEAFAQGRAHFHAQRYDQATASLERALAQAPGSQETRLLLGLAASRAGNPERAAELLTSVIEARKSTLLDLARFELAELLLGQGEANLQAATAELRDIVMDANSPLREDAAFRYAEALARHAKEPGQRSKARRALKDFVRSWDTSPLRREALLLMAQLDLAEGRTRAAISQLKSIAARWPQSMAAATASAELARLGTEGHAVELRPSLDDKIAFADELMRERRFEEASALLEALRADTEAPLDRAQRVEATRLLARAYTETRREGEALELYDWLAKRGHRISHTRRARLLALTGDYEAAKKAISDRYGRKRGLYWKDMADLHFDFGRYEEAYHALRQSRRGERRAPSSAPEEHSYAWRLGWCLLNMGKYERAAKWFKPRRYGSRRTRQWPLYWRARALQMAGKTEEALEQFEALAAEAPVEYYGIQAHSRALEIKGEAPDAPEVAALGGGLIGSVIGGAAQTGPEGAAALPTGTVHWSRESLAGAFDQAPQPASLDARVAALEKLVERWGEHSVETRRALELTRMGFTDEALSELRVLDMDLKAVRRRGLGGIVYRARADLLDNRGQKAARGGASMRSKTRRDRKDAIALGRKRREVQRDLREVQTLFADPYALRRRVYETGGLPTTPAEPLEPWRQAYPIAYPDLVRTFSELSDVPPPFVYAIMTVESTFHPHPVSSADAYGLLQVIPRTGRRLAAELGFGEFSPELLLKPEVSIYFGTHYLGTLLDKFQHQEMLAAAAYNAGPHRVEAWIRANPGRPMDVFIEEIPYRQARGYARSVLANIARYRRIYHGEERVYVTNHLDTRVLAQPNY